MSMGLKQCLKARRFRKRLYPVDLNNVFGQEDSESSLEKVLGKNGVRNFENVFQREFKACNISELYKSL